MRDFVKAVLISVAILGVMASLIFGGAWFLDWRQASEDAKESREYQLREDHGWIDVCSSCNQFCGWAWDPEHPDSHPRVRFFYNKREVGSITADTFREDLREAHVGNGDHSFVYAWKWREIYGQLNKHPLVAMVKIDHGWQQIASGLPDLACAP